MERFDSGLTLLEKIRCPLVVGNIPDASATVNKMLRPDQMPSSKAIAAANQRLKKWAASRGQVAVVDLSEFMRQALANDAITIRDYTLPSGQTRVLIQNDGLHPTPPGCSVLALAVLDAFQLLRPTAGAEEFLRDPKMIFRQVFKAATSPDSLPPTTK